MGSYHSRQIADLVLLLSELNFFNNAITNGLFIFCHYIDDGFMLTNNANRNEIITNLISTYPHKSQSLSLQIIIPFTIDLTISLNHHTIMYRKMNPLSSLPKTTSQRHVSSHHVKPP